MLTGRQRIRTFFIKAHVEKTFHIKNSRVYQWFEGRATNIFAFRQKNPEGAGLKALWDDRKDLIQQVRTWLLETAETFIVVQGPRGSGKRELVLDEALKDRKYKLVIDCKHIQDARGDNATIRAAAAEVGYRPVFSWMNSFSSLIDLAAQGTIGTKTGEYNVYSCDGHLTRSSSVAKPLRFPIIRLLGDTGYSASKDPPDHCHCLETNCLTRADEARQGCRANR